jgi:hypothetical protein
MFAKSARVALALAAIVSLTTGCATSTPNSITKYPSAAVAVPVRVTNESPEIVHVWFISSSGHKVRVGTVAPYGSANFTTPILNSLTGRFYIHRLSEDSSTATMGEFEPFVLGTRMIALRVGSTATFDSWQIR